MSAPNPPILPTPHRWQMCPVCHGRGLVPKGFYNFPGVPVPVYPATSTTAEKCRSCGGRGVL